MITFLFLRILVISNYIIEIDVWAQSPNSTKKFPYLKTYLALEECLSESIK
jgi:hypothetical protein